MRACRQSTTSPRPGRTEGRRAEGYGDHRSPVTPRLGRAAASRGASAGGDHGDGADVPRVRNPLLRLRMGIRGRYHVRLLVDLENDPMTTTALALLILCGPRGVQYAQHVEDAA